MKMFELWHGDCLDLIKNIPDNSVDLVVTSPPYDNLRTYNGSLEWSFEIFQNIARELKRVLKDGGVIVWVIGDATIKGSETGSSFKQALYFKEDLELNLHDTMIYKKDSCVFPEQTRYYPIFEYMFILTKGRIKTFNPIRDRKNKWSGLKKIQGPEYDKRGNKVIKRKKRHYVMDPFGVRHNIWEISTGCGKTSKDKINHPAMYPEKLAHDHIVSWSNEGDTVLDPFMGSGTTGKMCKTLNRKFIGIEKEKKYYDIAVERINSTPTE